MWETMGCARVCAVRIIRFPRHLHILTAARGLHTLELAIDYYFWKDALDGAPSFHRLLKSQTWPALCTVHFRGKTLTPCALVPFIGRHCRTVRNLTIQNTKFFEDAEWMDVFQSLSRENLKLNVLHLGTDLDGIWKRWLCTNPYNIDMFLHRGPSSDCLCSDCRSKLHLKRLR